MLEKEKVVVGKDFDYQNNWFSCQKIHITRELCLSVFFLHFKHLKQQILAQEEFLFQMNFKF